MKGGKSVATEETSSCMNKRANKGLCTHSIYRVDISLGINYETCEVEMTFAGGDVKGTPPATSEISLNIRG